MYGFIYTLHTLEPILANTLGSDANSAQSLPFIPGALVRGALIRLYQQDKKLNRIEAGKENSEVRRLFFDNKTRYLHAYPVAYSDQQRALPAPLAWQTHKKLQRGETTKNRLLIDLIHTERDSDTQLTGLGDARFCTLKIDQAYWADYPDQINVHTQRDAVAGRAKEDRGAVFRYEALPAGYLLKGVILTSTPEDAETLKNLLNGKTFTFGKARTAGYGLVSAAFESLINANGSSLRFRWVEIPDQGSPSYGEGEEEMELDETNIEDTSESLAVGADSRTFTLTLLSEMLVRDDHGQHTLDPLPTLKRLLENKAEGKKYDLKLDENKSFRQSTIVGGFNRKWGLPLPQVAAIAAGSAFTIQITPAIEDNALKILEETGIGERRMDGFGRLAIDWCSTPPDRWVSDDPKNAQHDIAPLKTENAKLTPEERKLGELMLRRLLRRDLDRELRAAIQQTKVEGDVPNSQLSRWRSVIYSAWSETDADRRLSRVSQFLEREAGERKDDPTRKEGRASSGWEKMHRARVISGENKKRLTEWIRELLRTEGHSWAWLTQREGASVKSFGVALSQTADLELHVEYRLRLIDGVLARAAKKEIDRKEKQGGVNG